LLSLYLIVSTLGQYAFSRFLAVSLHRFIAKSLNR
jgi:hypothetical protein